MDVINDGEYKIKFEASNYIIEREFYVGKKITIKGEKKNFFNYFLTSFLISISFFIIFLLITTFPKRILDFSYIDDWMLGNVEGKKIYWVISIFASPFILNNRINTYNPFYLRIVLFICTCYPLILPFQFFEPIKGHVGYSFLCFYLINKKLIYDEFSIFFNAFYFWFIIFPFSLFVSGFKFKKTCFFIFHFIFLYLFFGVAIFINFRFSGYSVKFWLLFLHPCFIIIPIILNVLMYISLYKYIKTLRQNEIIFDNDSNTIMSEESDVVIQDNNNNY